MRFFFNVISAARIFQDSEGEIHDTVLQAKQAADSLADALFRDSDSWHQYQLKVVDESGQTISCMPINRHSSPHPDYLH